mgnify:CR=1 FL=1
MSYEQPLSSPERAGKGLDQAGAEDVYWDNGNIIVQPHAADQRVKNTPYVMEVDHCVSQVLPLRQQVGQAAARINLVTSIVANQPILAKDIETAVRDGRAIPYTTTEGELLRRLAAELNQLAMGDHFSQAEMYINPAPGVVEQLAFIGEMELAAATHGIAEYWRWRLATRPKQQLYVVVGEIAQADAFYNDTNTVAIKSDEYIAERVFQQFSDSELDEVRGRIVVDEADVVSNPQRVDVIFLDDWVVTSQQLTDQYQRFIKRRPDLADRVEIQLVAANQRRIATGLEVIDDGGDVRRLPLRAYYQAPHAHTITEAYITGSHSSDYTLAMLVGWLAHYMADRSDEAQQPIPAGLQVWRQYCSAPRESLTFRRRLARSKPGNTPQ